MSKLLKKNINRKSNRNWVRATLSLRCFKQGFQTFVRKEIMGQHGDILKRLQETEGILKLYCGECTSENLLPQHSVKKKCIQKTRRHCFCSEHSIRRYCPNKVCSLLYDYIVKAHSTNDPLWINTDPSKWLTDYWELGKCFISTPGYADKPSATETDATGLLSIAINDIYFHDKMITDIESLVKMRDIRNTILHSASFSLEDDEVTKYIDAMIEVLQDKKAFASDAAAKDAILHLNELKNVQCHISFEDEIIVREETIKAIEDMTDDAVDRIRSTEANVMDGLRDNAEELRKQMKELTAEAKLGCPINSNKESEHKETQTMSTVQTITDNSVPVVNIYTRYQAKSQTNIENSEKQIKEPGTEAKGNLASNDRRESSYSNDKQEMQAALIELYQDQFTRTNLSPLLPEVQIGVDKVFVPPQLYETHRIDDYTDFAHEYYNIYGNMKKNRLKLSEFLTNIVKKNVLITADAGMGKTTLCSQILFAWCAAHKNSSTSHNSVLSPSYSKEPDVSSWCSYFRDIEFLFFISLKYCEHESTIEEMILKHLFDDKYYDSLYKLLKEEEKRCLIILDDLNEWTPPECTRDSPTISKGLPLRKIKSKYATIYTTRPWKLAAIRPKSGEFDMIIELEGIDPDYSDEHITLVSNYLNKITRRQRYSEEFVKSLAKNDLSHMKKYPLLSKLLLCLWHKLNLDTSLAGIYRAIVDHLVRKSMTDLVDRTNLKIYFDTFVLQLAEFSFCLLKNQRQLCYIYETTNLCDYGLSEDKLNVFVRFGFLSERICYGRSVSERCTKISFVYDIFQDYFAAVYLSIYPSNILDCCSSAEDILRMSLVFRILCGLNFSALKTISNKTLDIIDNDENCQDYRCGLSSYKGFIIEIQRMWLRCIKEARQCKIGIEPLALRDIYLGHGTSEYMLSICDIDFDKVRSLYCDIEIPFYTQEHIAQASHLDMLVCKKAEFVEKLIVEDILRKNQNSLKCLNLSGQCLTGIDISTNMFQNLCMLNISEAELNGEQFSKLVSNSDSLDTVRLKHVRVSGFEDVGNTQNSRDTFPMVSSVQNLMMSYCGNMFIFVRLLPSLKCLHFKRSTLQPLNEILYKSTNLMKLTIQEVDIGSDTWLIANVARQQHLKLFCLHAVQIRQFVLFELLDTVGYLPKTVRVKINDVEQEEGTYAKDVLHHLEMTQLFSYNMEAFEAVGNCVKSADLLSLGTNVLYENE